MNDQRYLPPIYALALMLIAAVLLVACGGNQTIRENQTVRGRLPDLGKKWLVWSTIQSVKPVAVSFGVNVTAGVTRSDAMSMGDFMAQLSMEFEREFSRLAKAKGIEVRHLVRRELRDLRKLGDDGLTVHQPVPRFLIEVRPKDPTINIAGTYVGAFDVSVANIDDGVVAWQANFHISRLASVTAHRDAGHALAEEMFGYLEKAAAEPKEF